MVTRLERRVCPHAVSGKMFWLCAITYIIALFGRMSYSAVMVALIANGSMDEAQAGLIGTALFVVYGVSQIFSGLIGDRISPKKMIFVGLIGSGILNLIMGLTGQYAVMLVVWALNGLFQSTMWSPIARIFAEQMPPDERKKCCNNIAVTYPLATILAYVLATVLLTAWNWRGVFLLAGGMIIITGINWMIRMSWFEKQIETSDEIEVIELQPKQTQKKENILRLLLLSGIVLATIPAMTHGMLRDGIQTWLPTLMTQNFHFGTSASVALDIIIPVWCVLYQGAAEKMDGKRTQSVCGIFCRDDYRVDCAGFGLQCQRRAVADSADCSKYLYDRRKYHVNQFNSGAFWRSRTRFICDGHFELFGICRFGDFQFWCRRSRTKFWLGVSHCGLGRLFSACVAGIAGRMQALGRV